MKPFKTKKINIIIVIVASITILSVCKKTNSLSVDSVPNPVIVVIASVAGIVTDLNNVPVSNASVAAGTSNTTTDVNGQFNLKNIQLSKDAGFVTVTRSGYFTGSRTFLVNTNTVNNIKIQLIPRTVSGSFSVVSGGNINISGGGTLNFGTNSIVNATTGAAFTGDVSVSTFYLNPSDINFQTYMPGNLVGLNSSNQQKILQSFGMAAIEMNNAAGEKLQLATGKTATITLPISSAMQASAPASIPLWYFDETKGIWKQEGTASKQGTNYTGSVAHFSFWTAGQLAQDIRLDATFTVDSSSSIALANKLVTISSANYGTTNGYTDNNGTVSGLIPANETLVMKMFNDCGDQIYSQNIGPFTADVNLGVIKIPGTNLFYTLSSITITGTVINCSNAPVTNGSVQVTSGNSHFDSPINNGSFNLTFSRCSNISTPLTLIASDAATGQSSPPQTINISGGTLNVGQISVCVPTIADFSYTAQGASVPVTVTFNNTSVNATGYVWDFGDGSTSTVQNPVHVYTNGGNYTITLSVTGTAGTNSISKPIHIPGTPNEYYINLTMNGTTYSWTYPDSISAIHTDTSGGTYNNTLIQATSANWIYFYIINDNTLPGNYNITLSAFINGKSYPNNNATTTVTEYGIVGGYITGTASGQMKELDSTTNIPFTLDYKVKRVQ